MERYIKKNTAAIVYYNQRRLGRSVRKIDPYEINK
jgi:hypothetical protein